jgi:DNA-binding transcriptional LysR family regulator
VDYRHLRFFTAVAEELHFTRAAHKLRVAQPHLSHEIRSLEREMGVELFVRTKRSVVLTPAGHVFLERVRALFDATADAVSAAQRASRGETGRLAVGFGSTAGYAVIPDAVARFRRTCPGVELLLTELNSDNVLQALRSGQLDVGLVHPPRNLEPALKVELAWREPLVVALPREHPLAPMRRINLKKLKAEPFVFWRRELASRLYDEIIAACDAAGFEPRVVQRTGRLATAVSLVASGVGVALVPMTAAHIGIKGAVFRAVYGIRTEVPTSFVWRQGQVAPAMAPFMAAVRDARLRTPHSRLPTK